MKPNSPSSRAALSLWLCAFLSAGAQAQPAYTELISPDNRANGRFGHACGGLPDLTGDGVEEFFALQRSPVRMYVYNGSSLELLYSIRPTCGFGFTSVDSASDLNDDGIPELMVSLDCGDGVGQVLVANGKTGANLYTLNSPNPVSLGYFGRAVRLLPDMTGDGKEDWLIHQQEYAGAGRAYIFDSQTRRSVRTIQNTGTGFTFHMDKVEVIPDVDGDGKPELLVSNFAEPIVRDGITIGDGRVLVRSLQTGQVLYELRDPEPQPGGFGYELKGIGDITGDGVGDIAVCALFKDGDTGVIYLFSGKDGQWLRTFRSPNPGPTGRFGRTIISLPDLNGDAVPELFTYEYPFGLAHVYDGATSAPLKSIDYPGPVGPLFFIGTVRQTAPPGLRALLFNSTSAGVSNEGRAYYMPFTPLFKPLQLQLAGMTTNTFRLKVAGDSGRKLEIQATGDFKTWEPLATVTLGDQPLEVEDSAAANFSQRFYRARQVP